MDYLQVILTTLLSVITLFIITRVLGYRQLSELSLFDYVNGITIGSIAAELATAQKDEVIFIFIAMVLYGTSTLFISFLTDKSIFLRKALTGKPIILLDKGKLCYKNFKKARLDINEFLMKCRNNGYFDLNEIDTAILEPNGKVSFIPSAPYKSVSCNDIKVTPKQEELQVDLVLDGKIIKNGLKALNMDEKWIIKEMEKQGISDLNKVFLATSNSNMNVTFHLKSQEKPKDIFE